MARLRDLAAALALVLAAPAASAEPLAESFVGTWTCRPRAGGEAFQWRVERRLAGRWLTGEGLEGGRVASLDVWAFDEAGRLGTRRQFTPHDALIELQVAERSEAGLVLSGELRRAGGEVVAVRETIRFERPDRFLAVWEALEGAAWRTVVDEACDRG